MLNWVKLGKFKGLSSFLLSLANNIYSRSNFLGTTFVIYSHGKNPVKREMTTKKKDLPIREELGAVLYVSVNQVNPCY